MSRQQANSWTTWSLAAAMAVAALGVCTTPALGQSITGTILGTVKDPQGGVLPGATLVLTSENRGTKGVPVITDGAGSYNIVNLQPDTYLLEVTMTGFKVYKRSGIALGAGERLAIPVVLEIGGTSETVDVTAEAPLVQAQSGERSFSVSTDMVANLPMSNRTFAALAGLAPGVTGGNNPTRIGGGGSNNITIDGMGNIDSGNNGQMLAVTNEVVSEVKVLTSNYQAEFGRNSGLQITAITKSGTNRFRGSVYDVERNSNWNAARKMDELLGTPRTVSKARDWGFTIGGPVGRPGGNNKLFFFFAEEFAPRNSANAVTDFRMPTELERQGDFSQSRDNLGNPFPYIRDPLSTLPCQTTPTGDHRGCFADGGVLGRIPTNRLYAPGLNVLRMFPLPNQTDIPAGQAFNTRFIAPEFSLTSTQPVVRVDYMPSSAIRLMFRYTGWRQPNKVITGSIPGWNDTTQVYPHIYQLGGSVNWTINATTFMEASYGLASEEEAGCAMGAAPGPVICRSGFAVNPIANRFNAGLGDLPYIFPDAGLVDPDYYAYRALNSANPSIWDSTQGRIVRPQSFTWGNRVSPAPPSVGYPGFLLKMYIHDYSGSVTKVAGSHTIKGGFYWQDNLKYQQRTNPYGTINFGNATTNPIDSGFGFANAALGIFTSYDQASKYVEGGFSYNQIEGYLQDNWKVTPRLTLDYGVRLVHQQPQYDYRQQSTNFLPETYNIAQAPVLYAPACPGDAPGPCANTRQAKNPITGQLLGPGTSAAIGTLVPNSGNILNGIHIPGEDIVNTTYKWPGLVVGPRFGAAYDVTGKQAIVLRGGSGVFFNRTSGNSVYDQISNPPTVRTVTLFNSTLDTLQNNNQAVQGAPNLSVFNYDEGLPTSAQWNGGIQMMLPWATAIDVEYVGQHSWNELEGTNLNSIDLGTLFQPSTQDPTQPVTTPGSNTLPVNMLRAFQGYGTISQQWARGWRWFHSLQFSFNRRFRNGLAFGFNDAIALSNSQSTAARLEHRPDGSYVERADQADADRLLGTDPGPRHNMKANFVWDLPDLAPKTGAMRVVELVVNDWQLSGIWTGVSGGSYNVGFSYQNGTTSANLTGSSDYNARIRVLGDPGSGCQSNQYRQFNTDAFAGPLVGSVGLESGNGYLKGCFSSTFDLAIARNINFGGGRLLQLRIEMFNAFNRQSVTARQTTMNLNSTSDPTTITNLPYDANGDLIVARSLPNNGAGFGVATGWQDPRAIQLQVRFQF